MGVVGQQDIRTIGADTCYLNITLRDLQLLYGLHLQYLSTCHHGDDKANQKKAFFHDSDYLGVNYQKCGAKLL